MPMSDAGLSTAIEAAIVSFSGAPSNSGELKDLCDALGQAIVEYIKANAQVHVTGVTPGLGTATGTVQ